MAGLIVFPTWRFPFRSKDFDVEQALVSGGTAINGNEDVIASDGGGRWYADLGDADLFRRDRVLLWRSFKSAVQYGAKPFIFPACDIRHQPTNGAAGVHHSDGASFFDGTLYSGSDCAAEVAVDAPLRATQLSISMSLGKPLLGGERFTIVHPEMRERCYQIGRVLALSDSAATFQFHPPAREAVPAGTEVDFINPRSVMRLDGSMSAPLAGPRWATGSVRFVEDFSGSYA